MSLYDNLKYFIYDNVSDETKGKLFVNSYITELRNSKKTGKKPSVKSNEFTRKILSTPGTSYGIYKYLSGKGKDKIPELVGHQLGDHWYTGIAKKLSGTSIGNKFVINRMLEKTLPRIGGNSSVAQQFMAAGGQV